MKSNHILPVAALACALFVGAQRSDARSIVTPAPAAVAATQLVPLDDQSATGDLTRGVEMYADRNYIGAIDFLNAAISRGLDPYQLEYAELYLALATAGDPGRADSGAELLEQFIDTYPASANRALAVMALAAYHFDAMRYDRALALYRSLDTVTLDGAQRDTRDFYMAYCLLKVAEYDRADSLYRRLTASRRYGDAARFYQAYIAYVRHDYDTALSLFDHVNTRTAPGDMTDYYRADIYYDRRDWSNAYATASRLLKKAPADVSADYTSEARRIAGEAAFNLGDTSRARTLLGEYFSSLAPGHTPSPTACYAMGVCLYDAADYDKAIPLLSSATDVDNAMGQSASLYIGQCYLKQYNYDAAILAFERATRMDFDRDVTETAFYNYAVAECRGGRVPFGSNVALFEDFLRRYPDSRYDADVRSYLAYGYINDNNYAAALRSIEKIRNMNDEQSRAYRQILYNLGARYLAAGDLNAASTELEKLLALRGGDTATRQQGTLLLADCRYRQGRYDDAARLCDTFLSSARRDTPNMPQARYTLGYALFADKQYPRAAKAFESFIASPGDADAATIADAECRLADIAFAASDFDNAYRRYDAAISRDAASGDYPMFQQAIIKGYHSDYARKVELLNGLISRYPNSARIPSALLELAESYRLAGNPAQAFATYDRLISTYASKPQGRQGMLLAAQLHLNAHSDAEAVSLYRRLIADYPTSAEARTAADALKDLYAADGRLDEYVSFIKSVPNAPDIEPAEIDRLTFTSAQNHYLATGDISRVTRYLEQMPAGQHRAAALLLEARAALDAGDDDTALNRATAVAVGFADSEQAPDALLIKGTVEARQGRDEEAMATLETLLDKAPDAATVDAARFGVMRAALRLNRLDRVLDTASELAGSSNLTPADLAEVDYTRALAMSRLGRYDEAAAIWTPLAARPDELYGAMSACRLGQQYLDRRQLADAERVANALVDSNTPHQYWLARGFILLSDVLRARGKEFEANEYLRSLRDNYPGTEADIFTDIEARLAK